jgi:large subunit ribosomal protein L6
VSRIGRMPVEIPSGVKVVVDGSDVTVTGPRGELSRSFHPHMDIALDGKTIVVSRPSNHRYHRSLHGLTRALLANMVEGVSQGFRKQLVIEGTGFRAAMEDQGLVLRVGYSHPILIVPPEDVKVSVDNAGVNIAVEGTDSEVVGETAAKIRAVRVCDPYKGKGIRYIDERVRRKPGKSGKVAAA